MGPLGLSSLSLGVRAVGGITLSPVRIVSAESRVPQMLQTMTTTNIGSASKTAHRIGSGDVLSIQIGVNGWAIPTGATAPLQAAASYTFMEMWVTKDGSSTGVQVTWGGATTKTINPGDTNILCDAIPASAFGLGSLTRGTKLWVGYRAEVVSTGDQIPMVTADYNPVTNSSIAYTPGSSTITNLQGSSELGFSGTTLGIGEAHIPLFMVGRFIGGDKPVFCAIGDSITYGTGDQSLLAAYGSWFRRSLYDDETTLTNPRAGLNMGCPSGIADTWAQASGQAKYLPMLRYCNTFVERYGINSIGFSGGQALANTIRAGRKVIWDFCRTASVTGGNPIYVCAIPLTPKVSGTFTTVVGQTPQAGCAQGQTIDLLDNDLISVAGTASGPDLYLDNTSAVRGDPSKANADYWRWGVTPSQLTADGLHPNSTAYTLMATAVRSWMQSRF